MELKDIIKKEYWNLTDKDKMDKLKKRLEWIAKQGGFRN